MSDSQLKEKIEEIRQEAKDTLSLSSKPETCECNACIPARRALWLLAKLQAEQQKNSGLRHGIAWCYQLAGLICQPVEVLDNLSALSQGRAAPHEWKAAECGMEQELTILREALERAIRALEFADTPESRMVEFHPLVIELRAALGKDTKKA